MKQPAKHASTPLEQGSNTIRDHTRVQWDGASAVAPCLALFLRRCQISHQSQPEGQFDVMQASCATCCGQTLPGCCSGHISCSSNIHPTSNILVLCHMSL